MLTCPASGRYLEAVNCSPETSSQCSQHDEGARLRRQRLPLNTSSQFTRRRPGQKRPQTQERRSRPRRPHSSLSLVTAPLRQQRLPFDISSQCTFTRPGQTRLHTQARRSRPALPHMSLGLVKAQLRRQRFPLDIPRSLRRNALAREAPTLQNGALARDILAIRSSR